MISELHWDIGNNILGHVAADTIFRCHLARFPRMIRVRLGTGRMDVATEAILVVSCGIPN